MVRFANRPVLAAALVVAVAMVMLPAPTTPDTTEPLVALIVDLNGNPIPGVYDMDLKGSVTWIGLAVGGYIPYRYSWYVTSVLSCESYDFTYTATSVGDHGVLFKVTDLLEQVATDSVTIHVHAPVPTRPTSWGRIKALYRR